MRGAPCVSFAAVVLLAVTPARAADGVLDTGGSH